VNFHHQVGAIVQAGVVPERTCGDMELTSAQRTGHGQREERAEAEADVESLFSRYAEETSRTYSYNAGKAYG
jgi:hypothetical protein